MNAFQVYRQTQTNTAAPGELVVMLYRGATRFVGAGVEAIEGRDIEGAHTNLVKAQAVVIELQQTLDLEQGGDLGRNLWSIYDYMNRRLIEANLRKDAQPAREVHTLLRELLGAWEAIVRQPANAPVAGRTPVAA